MGDEFPNLPPLDQQIHDYLNRIRQKYQQYLKSQQQISKLSNSTDDD